MNTDFDSYMCQLFPNDKTRKHVVKVLCQILNNEHNTKKIYVFQGPMSSGKTQFFNFVRLLMGQKCVIMSDNILYKSLMGTNHEFYNLSDKALVITESTREYVSNTMIKLIEGHPIKCHNTFNSIVTEIKPQFDIFLSTINHFRRSSEIDNRVHIFTFENTFVNTPDLNDPKSFQRVNVQDNFEQWIRDFKQKFQK